MRYLGQKTVVPLKANILSLFPSHSRYFELFAGTAEILRSKKPCEYSAVVEISDSLVRGDNNIYPPSAVVIHDCAISFIDKLLPEPIDTLVYCDPPYIISERSSKQSKYKHELTDEQHRIFLDKIKKLYCRVVISHYECSTYDDALLRYGWSKVVVPVSYRGTVRNEALYYNFPFEITRHESTRAGVDKTDRQRIKRKATRWYNKFIELPEYEQQAIIERIRSNADNPNSPEVR